MLFESCALPGATSKTPSKIDASSVVTSALDAEFLFIGPTTPLGVILEGNGGDSSVPAQVE
jgi:hypothetical protein